MTRKKYLEITNSQLYVYITYKTDYSSGKIEFKGLFFIEMYKRIVRLLKGVEIVNIFIKNEETGIVHKYCENLWITNLWLLENHSLMERN